MEDGMTVVTEILTQCESIGSQTAVSPRTGRNNKVIRSTIRSALRRLVSVWNGIAEISRRNVAYHNHMEHAPERWDYARRGAFVRGIF